MQKKTKLFQVVNNFRVKKFVFPFNNGVALVRDEKYSLAFIDSDGQKKVCSGKVKAFKGWNVFFCEAFYIFLLEYFYTSKCFWWKIKIMKGQRKNKTKAM